MNDRLDNLFDPQRLSKNWQMEQELPPEVLPAIKVFEQLELMSYSEYPSYKRGLEPHFQQARELLDEQFPKEGSGLSEKTLLENRENLKQVLNKVEDLLQALDLGRRAGR